ncbi:MAG: hypothetical protein ACOZF0_18375 [Thermodesulfobacteriota bacterium]
MISPTYDFECFAKEVENKELFEIISLAEQEATIAWGRTYRREAAQDGTAIRSMEYQSKLLGLIDYLRHSVKPRTVNHQDLKLFHLLREKVKPKDI